MAALRALSLPELQAAYAEHLAPGSQQRRKLAIHVAGKSHAAELAAGPPAGGGEELVEDLPGLQQRLGAWPVGADPALTVADVQG